MLAYQREVHLLKVCSFTHYPFVVISGNSCYRCLLIDQSLKGDKQIDKETRLSGGDSNQIKSLKQKLATTKKHLKPMITLLIAVLGSTFTMLYSVLYITVRVATVYMQFIELIFGSSGVYIFFLMQPLIYGLYYKQTREPMMKLLRSVFLNAPGSSQQL